MKTTAFTKYHIAAGAKMAEFAGYNMPIEFSGINDEHATVREKVGVFDVSHMGEIWVKGPQALPFLQYVTSNDVSVLYDGKVQYSCFPNGKGGIVDDLLVYRIDDQTYLLVVNAANTDKDWKFLCEQAPRFGLTPGKELYNASDEIAQLAVQGPLAMELVQELCPDRDVKGMEWEALWKAGEKYGLKNIGLGARDTLRLEMGFCLYGNDLDDTTSPIEAGLGWITKFNDTKGAFIDSELLAKQKAEGVQRKLVGFEMIERGIPRHGYEVASPAGDVIGVVTSGTQSPSLKKGVGLAYVKPEFAKAGTEIAIVIRGKQIKAQVVRPPFYKK